MSARDSAAVDVANEFLQLWTTVLEAAPEPVRRRVSALVDGCAADLADRFYSEMLGHDHAKLFLDNEVVNQRLHASMTRWVQQLFATLDVTQIPASIAHQVLVGSVHARIDLPSELMQMGFHVIAQALRARCDEAFPDPAERIVALVYVMDVFQIADSLMLSSYVRDLQSRVRKEEAYRVISMEHDVGLERERQRAALSEWANEFLVATRLRGRHGQAGSLAASEFGLWMKHKARIFFDGLPEVDDVFDVIRTIDDVHVPQLMSPEVDDETGARLIEDFRRQIEFIRYLVNDLFARLNKITLGRDVVTRLLNQRYLPTILAMEIREAGVTGKPFAVMLARIDDIRAIAPSDDQDSRTHLLQQLAVSIVDSVRAGDHAFRYGDTEFLIASVECDRKRAVDIAEELRLRVRALDFHLRSRVVRRLTVSVGVAAFDGHPDYAYLLKRAESAVARASLDGGDRVLAG